MKNKIIIVTMISLVFLIIPQANAESVPDWVKNTAGWWSTDAISEKEFVNAIQFLVNDKIIQVSVSGSVGTSNGVPDWVKNTAGWWSTDAISEKEFVNAIEFLIKSGIINIESNLTCQKDLETFSSNLNKINIACENYYSDKTSELIPYESFSELNKKGFVGEDFPIKKPNDEFRVFVLGGSVIQGSGNSSPPTTVPYILQKMIVNNNNESTVNVINAAGGGGLVYYQAEMIKTTLPEYEPDLVILFTGWNELSRDYPVMGVIDFLRGVCNTDKQNNFDIMIVLQPIAGFGNKVLTEQEKINSLTGQDHNGFQLLQARSTYDWLEREIEILIKNSDNNACTFHDLRNTFDDISGPIYWDQGHVSDTGNLILADRFLKELSKIYPNIFSYNEKFYNIIRDYNHPSITELIISELGINVDYSNVSYKDVTNFSDPKGNYFDLKENSGIEGILVGKDLRNVNLNSINLNGKDLTGANLSGQDLREIDITSTIIRGVDLSYTNLEEKDLSKMDLRGINFMGANLEDVNFTDAVFSKPVQIVGDCDDEDYHLNLLKNFKCISAVVKNEGIRTDFTNANLINAEFGIKETKVYQTMYFVDFTNAEMTDVSLNGVQIIRGNFTDAEMNGISGKQIYILESDFTDAEMKNFKISETWLQSTSFYNADMINGDFDSMIFHNVDFTGTEFQGTEFTLIKDFGDNNYNCKNNIICNLK